MSDGSTASSTRNTYPRAAWTVLVITFGTGILYNVWHAVHHGGLNLILAVPAGVVPLVVAAILSHIVRQHGGGRWLHAITYGVMLGAMGLSIGVTASVVKPVFGPVGSWGFGVMLDTATLTALWIILSGRSRKAAVATELAEVKTALADAQAEAVSARAAAAALETELTALRAELAEWERTPAAPEGAPATVVSMVGRAPSARTSAVPQVRTSGAPGTVSESAPDPLTEYAAELAAGALPSVRRIKAEMRVGQDRAKEIQAELRQALAAQDDGQTVAKAQ